MSSRKGETAPSKNVKESSLKLFLVKLRKRHIIETLAAFIGGGWLLIEVVERLLVGHYRFPAETIDLTVISVIGALLSTLIWRWFSSTEKRPGNVKVEVLIVPLIILVALAIDLNLIFQIAGIPGKKLLIGIIAFLLGIAWIVFKSLQWAASTPDAAVKKFNISKLAEIKPEKSIVVLPFADLSPQKDQEYFCDGMTEEIITDLSHVHELLVISRSSAMTFKGTTKKIPEIAGELKTRYVLEGSVRKAGNDLRIAAQLIDATNDAHIWVQKFSGTLDDVFDIQEKVSRSIVDALKIKLSSGENIKISERPIDNIQAYECYLKAKREMFAGTADGLNRALRDLEAGLDILGGNVLLYQGMAEAHLQHYEYGIKADEETLQSAEDFTKKVMSLKPNSAEGYYLLGRIERFRGTVIKAMKHFENALAIDPNHSSALLFLAAAYGIQAGKASLAEPLLRRLQEIDPLTPLSLFVSGYIQWVEGKLDHALLTFQNLMKMEPESVMIKFFMAYLLAWQKNYDQVFSLVDQMVRQGPHESSTLWSLALKYALQGEKKKALDVLSKEAKKYAWNDPESPWLGASIYALLDEKEEAFLWLEHAIDRGWINYPMFAERNPFFANIRGEDRFKKLMERVKYEWEHFEE